MKGLIREIFRRNGLAKMDELYFPDLDINWEASRRWWYLSENLPIRDGVQKELNKEVGPQHPLWGRKPMVIAKSNTNDDVLVFLKGTQFAVVHLIWHGKIDSQPTKYPSVGSIGDAAALKSYIEGL